MLAVTENHAEVRYILILLSPIFMLSSIVQPLELATEEERKAMTRKEKKQKDFFSQMEANILKNLAAGAVVPVKSRDSDEERDCIAELVQEKAACGDVSSNMSLSSSSLKPKSKLSKPQMVRTISSMDNNVLAELTRVEKGGLDDTKRRVSPTSVITGNENSFLDSDSSPEMMRCDILNLRASDSEEEEDRAIEELRLVAVSMSNLAVNEVADDACRYSGVGATPSNLSSIESPDFQSQHKLNGCKAMLAKPSLLKRNTCGTLYVGSTMSAPDKDATIKVSLVHRLLRDLQSTFF